MSTLCLTLFCILLRLLSCLEFMEEFANMAVSDVDDRASVIVVSIPKTKT